MDKNKPLGQEPSGRLKQLEQELGEIHKKATETYKDNKPHKFFKAPGRSEEIRQTKPTYLEESQAVSMTQHVQPDEQKPLAARFFVKETGTGKSKVVLKIGLGLLGLALAVAMTLFLIGRSTLSRKTPPASWEECVQEEGSIIMESFPRVCTTKAGERFVEPVQIETPTQTPTPTPVPTGSSSEEASEQEAGVKDGCVITGCNSEICVDETESDIASICVYKPEYGCYKQATCQPQADGDCGWTQTEELKACLEELTQPK